MYKTIYEISKMDCPSEEALIRMKLEGIEGIHFLEFDIPGRRLEVFHDGIKDAISDGISELQLGSRFISSEEVRDQQEIQKDHLQKKILWAVLGINFAFFLIEMTTGIISGSMGLVADSLDMLADAFVYGLSLYAVGSSISRKKRVAQLAGYFQLGLAILGFGEVLRRFFGMESNPHFQTMIIISLLALAANTVCLWLLQKSRSKEAHMRASMIFTSNDIIINLGVILAGIFVFLFSSAIPDLIIGAVVFLIVIRGAFRILKLSK